MKNQELLELLESGSYRGFSIKEIRYVEDLDCEAVVLNHKSGAVLCYLPVMGQDKCFDLSFKVFPEDNTGVLHIIEHTLLSGSQKYGVKNWGGNGLLHNFYGAFTMRDASLYAVCSQDEYSFQELVKIYTDAVFAPLVDTDPRMMLQEGWHYEYDPDKKEYSYSGIVLSEQSVYYTTPALILSDAQLKTAVPDSSFSVNIGGDPLCIPDLTYEHFLETYHKFFVPKNCLAYVSGSTELSSVLDVLDSYWKDYSPNGRQIDAKGKPAAFSGAPNVLSYPAVSGDKDMFSFQWIVGNDSDTCIGCHILVKLLNEYLKAAFPETDVETAFYQDYYFPMFTVVFKGVNEDDFNLIRDRLKSVIRSFIDNGLQSAKAESAVASVMFQLNQSLPFAPKAFQDCTHMTSSFAHGEDLFSRFNNRSSFRKLQTVDLVSYLLNLADRILVNNEYYTELILKADMSFTSSRRAKLAEKLENSIVGMTESQIATILKETADLHKFQSEPDDPALVAALPRTKKEDLDRSAPDTGFQIYQRQGKEFFFLPSNNDLINVTLHFGLPNLSEEELHLLGVLRLAFGNLNPVSMTLSEYSDTIGRLSGGIKVTPQWYRNGSEEFQVLQIKFSTFADRYVDMMSLVLGLIKSTDYDNAGVINTLLSQFVSSFAQAGIDPISRSKAYHSSGAAAEQHWGGVEFYNFAKNLLENFDDLKNTLIEDLRKLQAKVMDERYLTLGFHCKESFIDEITSVTSFPSAVHDHRTVHTDRIEGNEVFIDNRGRQFNALTAEVKEYSAAMLASATYAANQIRMRIREIGGAYHVKASLTPDRDIVLMSTRDPHLTSSFSTFRSIPEFIRAADENEINDAIIKASASFNAVPDFEKSQITYSAKETTDYDDAVRFYYDGYTKEDRQRQWAELVTLTPEDFRKTADIWEDAIAKASISSLANQNKVDEEQGLFSIITRIN